MGQTKIRKEMVKNISCRVYKSAEVQSINNGTFTAVVYDAEDFDTDSMHDNSTNNTRITVPSTGLYLITATVSFAANATGERVVTFRVNGNTGHRIGYQVTNGSTTLNAQITTTTILNLTAADYVEVFAYQLSGGALNLVSDNALNGLSVFSVARIG